MAIQAELRTTSRRLFGQPLRKAARSGAHFAQKAAIRATGLATYWGLYEVGSRLDGGLFSTGVTVLSATVMYAPLLAGKRHSTGRKILIAGTTAAAFTIGALIDCAFWSDRIERHQAASRPTLQQAVAPGPRQIQPM